VLGALNIASVNANLFSQFEDANDLQEDWDDFEGDDRMLRAGNGRRGRKGRGGKKNKAKGPFDIEKYLAKVAKRMEKKEGKLAGKCEKKLNKKNKMCSFIEDEENCKKWALAKQVGCLAYG